MAIVFDTTSTQTRGTNFTDTMSWTHVCTGSNLILLVMVSTQSGTNTNPTGITYNSAALTLIDTQANGNPSLETQVWYLLNPSTGSNTIEVTWNGDTIARAGGIGMSLTGVSAIGAKNKASGADTTPTVSLTTTVNNSWVANVMEVGNDPEFGTPTGTNQTDRQQLSVLSNYDMQIDTQTTTAAGSYTQSYSKSGSSQWATISVEIKATAVTTTSTSSSSSSSSTSTITGTTTSVSTSSSSSSSSSLSSSSSSRSTSSSSSSSSSLSSSSSSFSSSSSSSISSSSSSSSISSSSSSITIPFYPPIGVQKLIPSSRVDIMKPLIKIQ